MSLDKKLVKIGNLHVSLFIWDTAGQEKFFALTKAYFKKADGVLIVFDLTSRTSFESNFEFMQELKSTGCSKSKRSQTETVLKFWLAIRQILRYF
jgi:GTPase SAR1 family protein